MQYQYPVNQSLAVVGSRDAWLHESLAALVGVSSQPLISRKTTSSYFLLLEQNKSHGQANPRLWNIESVKIWSYKSLHN